MFTERQLSLLATCKAAGYGWKKFALSVEAQGLCSILQEDTLVRMHQKITHVKCHAKGNMRGNSNSCWDSDISDSEAYRSGDYF